MVTIFMEIAISYNHAIQNKSLKIEESKGNNYVVLSDLAIYHQTRVFRKEIIPNV